MAVGPQVLPAPAISEAAVMPTPLPAMAAPLLMAAQLVPTMVRDHPPAPVHLTMDQVTAPAHPTTDQALAAATVAATGIHLTAMAIVMPGIVAPTR